MLDNIFGQAGTEGDAEERADMAETPTLMELEAKPGGLRLWLEGHPEESGALRATAEGARRAVAGCFGDAASAALDAPLSTFLSTMRSIDPEALERGLKEMRRLERSDRHRPSPDFAPLGDDPEACERFREWARESLERSGGFTYTRLAEALNVDRETAKGFYNEPWRTSVHAARFVRFHAGEEGYFNILHGAGAYDARAAEDDRDRALREAEERFGAAIEALRERGPREALMFLEAIKHAVSLYSALADV